MRRSLTGLGLLLLLWYALSALTDVRILPPPHLVGVRLAAEAVPILRHAAASLARVLAALVLSAVLAVPLGIVMGRRAGVDRVLTPLAYLLYPIPKISLLPMLLLLLGTGNVTRVTLVTLVLFFQMLLAVRDSSRAVEQAYLQAMDSLGGSPRDRFRHVIWPSVLPRLLSAVRIASATALAVLFFAETFFTELGLGYYIVNSWLRLDYLSMYAGILAMSLVGLLLFAVVDLAERRVSRWRG